MSPHAFRFVLPISVLVFLSVLCSCTGPRRIAESRQATGVKVGEVTDTSAIIWMRVTESEARRADGIERRGRADREHPEVLDPSELEGSAPGAPGRVRVLYGTTQELTEPTDTGWHDVDPDNDFTHQFELGGLEPDTVYYYSAETGSPDGSEIHEPLRGRFQTAPEPDEYGSVTFTVITGQAYRDVDSKEGFLIYDAMRSLNPQFLVATGDTVYYDSDDPLVTTIDMARYHWHRMYSYGKLIRFHLRIPAYWEKDDHDSYHDDNWPGLTRDYMGSFTFEQGLKVYDEQVPMSDKPYRTFRWGQGLQIWLTEGRDFRSPNTMDDGPNKSIWGAEQKKWLKETLLESDADWKVLVSPTPIVGPDRSNKADNHSNEAFRHEGDEFRSWAQQNLPTGFFVACGDRHWQYHSVHPTTKVQEFSSGPASDQHAGGSPGQDPAYHRFHRQQGGFLSINARRVDERSAITFRLHDVNGNVVYDHTELKPLP